MDKETSTTGRVILNVYQQLIDGQMKRNGCGFASV